MPAPAPASADEIRSRLIPSRPAGGSGLRVVQREPAALGDLFEIALLTKGEPGHSSG